MTSAGGAIVRRGVVGVVREGGRFLVIRRSQHVVAPGAYCFPGGGIEAGEDEAAALVRELAEELGVVATPSRRLWSSETPWKVALAWWLCEIEAGTVPVPNPLEVESVHWHTAEEMAGLPGLLASNLHFLEAWTRGEFQLDDDDPSGKG